jgi:hypothetical protein
LISEVTQLDKSWELIKSPIANGQIIGFVEIASRNDSLMAIKLISIIGKKRNLWIPKLLHLSL